MKILNGVFFPTKLVVIDDNQSFLSNLSIKFSEQYNTEAFHNPDEAIEYIVNNLSHSPLSNLTSTVQVNDEIDMDLSYIFDFDVLRNLQSDPGRFDAISCIVVDYSMPNKNGVEVCEALKTIPIPKIMLTGHADFEIAVNAFNKGIIDYFIVKNSSNMMTELSKAIESSTQKFFNDATYPLMNILSSDKNSIFANPDYNESMKQLLAMQDIREYYLTGQDGGYQIILNNFDVINLSAFTENDFDNYLDIVRCSDNNFPAILEQLSSRTAAPVFENDAERNLPVCEWMHLMREVKKYNSVYVTQDLIK